MDRSKLEKLLAPFVEECARQGKPLSDICIEEAFPGDVSTPYIVVVRADWIDGMDCSSVLDFLIDVLWETVDEKARRKVFFIRVLDSRDQLHCEGGELSPEQPKELV